MGSVASRDGDRFFTQATHQDPLEIFAQSSTDFFARWVDLQITFVSEANGRATELIVHQNGHDHHARRISAPPPAATR